MQANGRRCLCEILAITLNRKERRLFNIFFTFFKTNFALGETLILQNEESQW